MQSNPNSTPPRVPRQSLFTPGRITLTPGALAWVAVCPTAKTFIAKSTSVDTWHVWATCCNRWSCHSCARSKIALLAHRTSLAQPTKLLTLTLDPKHWTDPRQCFEKTSPLVAELVRVLRKRWGEVEYLRVTEVTQAGWPHYHLLVRSGFLPQPIIKAEWERLTKATIVDVRKIENQFNTFNYLCKYLTKMHKLTWTERHVSYSRNFFRDDHDTRAPRAAFTGEHRNLDHPYVYLSTRLYAAEVDWVTRRHWTTQVDPDLCHCHYDRIPQDFPTWWQKYAVNRATPIDAPLPFDPKVHLFNKH